jgi:magnesium chelatase family protein
VLACLRTAAVFGVDACAVHVEVDVSFGFPSFTMVGLPTPACRESRDRVKSAIRNSGFEFPPHASPSTSRRPTSARPAPRSTCRSRSASSPRRASSSGGDRRLSCCSASSRSTDRFTRRAACCRSRRPPRATAARHPAAGRQRQRSGDRLRARRVAVSSLADAVRALNEPGSARARLPSARPSSPDPALAAARSADVRGQLLARRALEIAAAGGHNLLLVGPPGAGKTMMARRVAGILPPLTFDEALDVDRRPLGRRPAAAGGGCSTSGRSARRITPSRTPRCRRRLAAAAGEVSLAHHGVLFLDEMLEFSRHVLEVLRQPLEEGSRADRARGADRGLPRPLHARRRDEPVSVRFLGDAVAVPLPPPQIARYRDRLSGPLAIVWI